jgi:hypothetical protein
VIQLFAGVHGAQTCVLLEPDFDHQLRTAIVDDHGLPTKHRGVPIFPLQRSCDVFLGTRRRVRVL